MKERALLDYEKAQWLDRAPGFSSKPMWSAYSTEALIRREGKRFCDRDGLRLSKYLCDLIIFNVACFTEYMTE